MSNHNKVYLQEGFSISIIRDKENIAKSKAVSVAGIEQSLHHILCSCVIDVGPREMADGGRYEDVVGEVYRKYMSTNQYTDEARANMEALIRTLAYVGFKKFIHQHKHHDLPQDDIMRYQEQQLKEQLQKNNIQKLYGGLEASYGIDLMNHFVTQVISKSSASYIMQDDAFILHLS